MHFYPTKGHKKHNHHRQYPVTPPAHQIRDNDNIERLYPGDKYLKNRDLYFIF